jgi:hypothetical protein
MFEEESAFMSETLFGTDQQMQSQNVFDWVFASKCSHTRKLEQKLNIEHIGQDRYTGRSSSNDTVLDSSLVLI